MEVRKKGWSWKEDQIGREEKKTTARIKLERDTGKIEKIIGVEAVREDVIRGGKHVVDTKRVVETRSWTSLQYRIYCCNLLQLKFAES